MKECPVCYKKFKPSVNPQKYCSRKCSNEAFRDRVRKGNKTKTPNRFPNDIMACRQAFEWLQG